MCSSVQNINVFVAGDLEKDDKRRIKDGVVVYSDFSNANIALSNQFNDDELRKIGLNDIQINDVRNGKPSSPTGFTWHHHQDVGKMQLVSTKSHRGFPHTGGCKIWSKFASCPVE